MNINMIFNIFNNSFSFDFSYENQLISVAFIIVALVTNLYAMGQNRKSEVLVGSLYLIFSLICLFAGDLVLMFVSLEIMVIYAGLLIFYGHYKNSMINARQYFLTHLVSGSLILIGISYIITKDAGTQITSLTSLMESEGKNIYYILLLSGCLINVAVPPFSGWLVNSYTNSSSSGLIYLTSFTSKVSIMMIVKLFAGLEILKFFGIITIIYSGIYACIENNIKRLICYFTVSQLGFMLIAIGTKLTHEHAIFGIAAFLFVNIIYKALFALYMAILMDQENIEDCSEIKVLISIKSPLLCSSLILSIFLMIAFPPLAGFTTKIFIMSNLSKDFSYYIIFALKIITCLAVFTIVKYKNIKGSFSPKLNIFSKASLFIAFSVTFIISFWLEKFLKLIGLSYPMEVAGIGMMEVVKELTVIFVAIILAIIFNRLVSRRSTRSINMDLFRIMENALRNLYSKYQQRKTQQEEYHYLRESYNILDILEKGALHKIKSLHNQSASIFIVMVMLIVFTLSLISSF
ncbi:MAG: proton-conducting transporter membrane subunit [Candidatus Rickettsia vulgarisii]